MIGLGVADDKGGCAAAMLAARGTGSHRANSWRAMCSIALVIDEEGVSIGTEHLVANHADEIDMAINLEPDGSHTIFGEHQGFGWIDIVVHGVPAHGSAPEKGVDAIVHMAEVITRLHKLDKTQWTPNPDPKKRPNGVPHRHDSRRHRLRHLPQRGGARHRDRHAARRDAGRPRRRDRGDLRRGQAGRSRGSPARSGCGWTATRSPARATRRC